MDALYSVALSLVEASQPILDGGLLAYILNEKEFGSSSANSSRTPAKPQRHLRQTLTSGGYAAALAFGIIWFFLLLLGAVTMCVINARRRKNSKSSLSLVTRQISITRHRLHSQWLCAGAQFILLCLMIAFLLIAAILGLRTTIKLHKYVTTPASNLTGNDSSTAGRTGVFPQVITSLDKIRYYLADFADNAAISTRPTVNRIIHATEVMQNETSKEFNKILMGKLGVADTFRLGEEMSNQLFILFDHAPVLDSASQVYQNLVTDLDREVDDFKGKVDDVVRTLRQCDSSCQGLHAIYTRRRMLAVNRNNDFPNPRFTFATSFLYVMNGQNKTKASIRADMAYGKLKSAEMMDKMYRRMQVVLNIPESILNMTNAVWRNMSRKMTKDADKVSAISLMVAHDGHRLASRYESIVLVIFLIIWLLVFMFVVLLVGTTCHYHCVLNVLSGAARNRIKLTLYILIGVLSLLVLFAMVLFLLGGYAQTEVCRYLKPNRLATNDNSSQFVLDNIINKFLDKNWAAIEAGAADPTMKFPLPRPKNILQGITTKCAANAPILDSLNALDSLDPSALNRPELSARFVSVGRMLMKETIEATDPVAMMPPDMQRSLGDAKQLDMFTTSVNFDECIRNLPLIPFRLNDSIPYPVADFVANWGNLRQYFVNSGVQIGNLDESYTKVQIAITAYQQAMMQFENALKGYKQVRPIRPIVESLQTKLGEMLSVMSNKTLALSIADSLFTEVIEATTPAKAQKVMAKYGPEMMGSLGRCRPIYDAYSNVVNALCTSVVAYLNGLWLFLGLCVLLSTPLFIVTLMFALNKSSHDPETSPIKRHGDHGVSDAQEMNSLVSKPSAFTETNNGTSTLI